MFYYEISRRRLGLGKLSFVLSVVCELFGKFYSWARRTKVRNYGAFALSKPLDGSTRVLIVDWLRRDSTDVFRAHCRVCQRSFDVKNMGEGAVKSHGAGVVTIFYPTVKIYPPPVTLPSVLSAVCIVQN